MRVFHLIVARTESTVISPMLPKRMNRGLAIVARAASALLEFRLKIKDSVYFRPSRLETMSGFVFTRWLLFHVSIVGRYFDRTRIFFPFFFFRSTRPLELNVCVALTRYVPLINLLVSMKIEFWNYFAHYSPSFNPTASKENNLHLEKYYQFILILIRRSAMFLLAIVLKSIFTYVFQFWKISFPWFHS